MAGARATILHIGLMSYTLEITATHPRASELDNNCGLQLVTDLHIRTGGGIMIGSSLFIRLLGCLFMLIIS